MRRSAWNLLLLAPFLMLLMPCFADDRPRLFGVPFFYWSQLLFVPFGVGCVWLVYRKTLRSVPPQSHRDHEG